MLIHYVHCTSCNQHSKSHNSFYTSCMKLEDQYFCRPWKVRSNSIDMSKNLFYFETHLRFSKSIIFKCYRSRGVCNNMSLLWLWLHSFDILVWVGRIRKNSRSSSSWRGGDTPYFQEEEGAKKKGVPNSDSSETSGNSRSGGEGGGGVASLSSTEKAEKKRPKMPFRRKAPRSGWRKVLGRWHRHLVWSLKLSGLRTSLNCIKWRPFYHRECRMRKAYWRLSTSRMGALIPQGVSSWIGGNLNPIHNRT